MIDRVYDFKPWIRISSTVLNAACPQIMTTNVHECSSTLELILLSLHDPKELPINTCVALVTVSLCSYLWLWSETRDILFKKLT